MAIAFPRCNPFSQIMKNQVVYIPQKEEEEKKELLLLLVDHIEQHWGAASF